MTAVPPEELLARALLPLVLRRLERTASALTRGDSPKPDAIARAEEDSRRLGWAVAVLGSAAGGELLQVRREPRGLEVLVALVDEVLREDERSVQHAHLPDLAADVGRGWELPWALASLLLAAARSAPPGPLDARWGRNGGRCTLTCSHAANDAVRWIAGRLASDLPDARFREERGGWSLSVPGGWLPRPSRPT